MCISGLIILFLYRVSQKKQWRRFCQFFSAFTQSMIGIQMIHRKFLWAIVNCGRGGMVDRYLTFLEVLELNLTIFSHLLSFSWIWRFAIVIILSFKLIEFIINMADRDGVKMCAMSDWWCLTIPLLIGCRQQCRLLILHSAEWCQPAVPAWQLYRIKRRSVFCL